jgi:hypothetical protein
MSRIRSQDRKKVADDLTELYGRWFSNSHAYVHQLRFSPHPSQWQIRANPILPGYVKHNMNVCDVEITATLPTCWIQKRISPVSAEGESLMIAGEVPMTPPPGVDVVRLIAFSRKQGASRLQLTPRWGFHFFAHGTGHLCGIYPHPPMNLPAAIASAHQEFREHLAGIVAKRLLPKAGVTHSRPFTSIRG